LPAWCQRQARCLPYGWSIDLRRRLLGQISDVTAYYLIIAGTHEQRREQALFDRFDQLGITDERMRLKILGSLSAEQEEKIFQDIEEEKFSLIDDILKQAETDQKEMEKN
jgi:hypothetical protein